MPRGFISLGRGMTINKDLVANVVNDKGRYYINDVYGMSYQVDKKHYKKAKSLLN